MKLSQIKTALPRKGRPYAPPEKRLYTRWGKRLMTVLGSTPLTEYPRPQMVRPGAWRILNGWWDCAFSDCADMPDVWKRKIRVPFSPESLLSGVTRQLQPDEYLWYRRGFIYHSTAGKRLLLHFGAVDQECIVYCNGVMAGEHHGGYLPFTIDLTRLVRDGANTLCVCVKDYTDTSYYTRGKQKLKSGGMFYTAQSGIWQSVWLETVPDAYIPWVRITPEWESASFKIRFDIMHGCKEHSAKVSLYSPARLQDTDAKEEMLWEQEVIAQADLSCIKKKAETVVCAGRIQIPQEHRKAWSPDSPWLYGLCIETKQDRIFTYSALRLFTCEEDSDGIKRICLNHEPIFMNGVLDQGYWPDSLMTPPSDKALLYDITEMQKAGFNMIRKHCKLESDRFYYHCDRLGMMIWQDMVNGGEAYDMMQVCYLPTAFPRLWGRLKDKTMIDYRRTGRRLSASRRLWKKECAGTVKDLYNHPCIAVWVLFNEGWGQFDSKKNCDFVRKMDPTRIIDASSGWFDQGAGDLRSVHNYFRPLSVEKSHRAFVISEYGGFGFFQKEHSLQDEYYGYGLMKSEKELQERFAHAQRVIRDLEKEGLCGAVYTQVSDIEDECNGILTYDREIHKISNQSSLEEV